MGLYNTPIAPTLPPPPPPPPNPSEMEGASAAIAQRQRANAGPGFDGTIKGSPMGDPLAPTAGTDLTGAAPKPGGK